MRAYEERSVCEAMLELEQDEEDVDPQNTGAVTMPADVQKAARQVNEELKKQMEDGNWKLSFNGEGNREKKVKCHALSKWMMSDFERVSAKETDWT